jgi:hypothetical protein
MWLKWFSALVSKMNLNLKTKSKTIEDKIILIIK